MPALVAGKFIHDKWPGERNPFHGPTAETGGDIRGD